MESVEEGREFKVVDGLVKKAVQNMFSHYYTARDFEAVLDPFRRGLDRRGRHRRFLPCPTLDKLPTDGQHERDDCQDRGSSNDPSAIASAMEFILEGLYLNRRLNRDQTAGHIVFSA